MGYTKQAIKGISWMSAFRIITRLISFLKIAVLARVLTPDQFGIFGIATLVLTFLEIVSETGINIILIQIKDDIKKYIDSAWVVSIIRGMGISLIIILSAPFIASFFNAPEALNIILLISVVPFIRGFINPYEIKFQKELNFNYEFWFRTFLFFIDAAVSIVAVLLIHSVYALVLGLIAGALTEVIISFALIKPTPKFAFNFNYVKEILRKGKWITLYSIFNYLGENGDNVVVGKFLGTSFLGIYQIAYKLSILPISEVSDVVSRVVFPVYMKIEEDRERLLSAFFKTTFLITLGAFLVGGIIYFFPVEIVKIILGQQWLAVIPVLRVLTIYGIIRAVSGPASALFLAKGKQNYVTLMTFVRFATLAITIYPLVIAFGIVGAGYSALVSVLMEFPIIIFLIVRIFSGKNS